jgi:hypothetical protein
MGGLVGEEAMASSAGGKKAGASAFVPRFALGDGGGTLLVKRFTPSSASSETYEKETKKKDQ